MDGEIGARVEGRRQWTPAEKAALLAEIEAAGGEVSTVAQRHEISKSLIYNSRSAWKAAALAAPGSASGSPGFIQLGVVAGPLRAALATQVTAGARGGSCALADRVGVMEIDLPDGFGCGSMPASMRWRYGGLWRRCAGGDDRTGAGTRVFLACQPVDLRAGFYDGIDLPGQAAAARPTG